MASNRHALSRRSIPSVDHLLRQSDHLIAAFGRSAVAATIRELLGEMRAQSATPRPPGTGETAIIDHVANRLAAQSKPLLRRVLNLTGTVLHTNLGRASLPAEAMDALAMVAAGASNLEYDLRAGRRGDRDAHIEAQLCRLTGAEAATVVNNNAAAVLLILNTLALGKQVPVSRGELIEIGDSFRMPDIMRRSGCRLVEVGTTNRTHLRDYAESIGPRTGLVMKVHTSNYAIKGFTASVSEVALAKICRDRGVPFAVDLGSGALVDLRNYGLPHEPTPMEALKNGADLVSFSGDKLLGGPQAGIIVGQADLVARIRRNAMKRALRVDKLTVAALSSVLALYTDPDRLAVRLPTLRALKRPLAEIRNMAKRLQPIFAARLDGAAAVDIVACDSEIGSGALATQQVASAGLAIRPATGRRGAGTALKNLAQAFRSLPVPVIGRIAGGAFLLDLRCLDDETTLAAQLPQLAWPDKPAP